MPAPSPNPLVVNVSARHCHLTPEAVEANLEIDFRRNSERYRFIRWIEQSVDNFRVVPPGTGIIHQVNMESLAQVVWESRTATGERLLHPDDMVATDSHTPMINSLGIVAWGVGGLEGQAAMLGEPVPIEAVVRAEVLPSLIRGFGRQQKRGGIAREAGEAEHQQRDQEQRDERLADAPK